jgi:hypothetical protein
MRKSFLETLDPVLLHGNANAGTVGKSHCLPILLTFRNVMLLPSLRLY